MDETTIIDLKKPADVTLVNRAIVNGWDIHPRVRDQILEQMHGALEHFQQLYADGGGVEKYANQLLRIIRLMQTMTARNQVDEGVGTQSEYPNLRRRAYPERRRRPRARRLLEPKRMATALARKAAREAAASHQQEARD
jgi:hypothetical protein